MSSQQIGEQIEQQTEKSKKKAEHSTSQPLKIVDILDIELGMNLGFEAGLEATYEQGCATISAPSRDRVCRCTRSRRGAPESTTRTTHCTGATLRKDEIEDKIEDEIVEQLGREVIKLTEENVKLQQVNRACAAQIADLAHEVRNSLAAVRFYVELLTKGHSIKYEHYQQMTMQSIERLHHLVEDTLDISRLELGKEQPVEMEPLDLNELVRDGVLLHQAQAEAAGLSLTHKLALRQAFVQGNRLMLSQVIANLITNAIKYTQHGRVLVTTRILPATDEIVLEVIDSGIGIAARDLPYIFERFYRAQDTQLTSISGTGLGLAIVQEIVRLHQGHISVESDFGIGSRFCVRLPALRVM